MNELKPCPFCGGRESVGLTTVGNDNYVSCAKCGIRTHSGIGVNRTAEQVSKSWNHRAPEPLSGPQPLTPSELRERVGKPVYIVVMDKTIFADKADAINGWGLVRRSWAVLWDAARADMVRINHDFEDYGKSWLAYDRPPKEDA